VHYVEDMKKATKPKPNERCIEASSGR
jgi:hypothetical protein